MVLYPRYIFLGLLGLSLFTQPSLAIPSPKTGMASSISGSRLGTVLSSSPSGSSRSSPARVQRLNAATNSQADRRAALSPADKDFIELLKRQYPQWERKRARSRKLKRSLAQTGKQTHNLESLSVASTSSRSRHRDGSSQPGEVDTASLSSDASTPDSTPSPDFTDSSDPHQHTKSLKNFSTERLKRAATDLGILHTEHRTGKDDEPPAADGIDKFPGSPASEGSASASPSQETQKAVKEEPEAKEDEEEAEEGEKSKKKSSTHAQPRSHSESQSTTRHDILQNSKKHPGRDRSISVMPRAIDRQDENLLSNTGNRTAVPTIPQTKAATQVEDEGVKEAHQRMESVNGVQDGAVRRPKDTGVFTAKDAAMNSASGATPTSPTPTAKTAPMTKPRIGTVKKPAAAAGSRSGSGSGKAQNVKKGGKA
jgi:hypothetical protein